ncbi:hypothetical protein [Demequina litorisediminis]|uniref:hypothetical protein n=1 Tax=Demequina litorisediminis TaxID=1849022 RepID=UPI0024E1821D|nr:hypothetical protein [Demequina litorisediminis]
MAVRRARSRSRAPSTTRRASPCAAWTAPGWTYDGDAPNGFQFEAAEVARGVAAGLTESPLHTLEHSLEIMRIMDEVRAQIGVVYPNER